MCRQDQSVMLCECSESHRGNWNGQFFLTITPHWDWERHFKRFKLGFPGHFPIQELFSNRLDAGVKETAQKNTENLNSAAIAPKELWRLKSLLLKGRLLATCLRSYFPGTPLWMPFILMSTNFLLTPRAIAIFTSLFRKLYSKLTRMGWVLGSSGRMLWRWIRIQTS